jgi:hypothetical protein
MDGRILRLPDRAREPGIDDLERFDAWIEEHCRLMDAEDYPALVKLCESMLTRNPSEVGVATKLGEAYVLNGEHERAIEFMRPWLDRYPDGYDFQHVVLDALFAQGKTEDDFPWKERPEVIRLTADTLDFCYEYLRPKRKPRAIDHLSCELLLRGYLAFSVAELRDALKRDGRFVVTNDRFAPFAEVRAARKG